jgi:hypothetical protein
VPEKVTIRTVLGWSNLVSFGEVFTFVQGIMTFLVVTDVFYERIIQDKILPKMNANLGLLGLSHSHHARTRCGRCLDEGIAMRELDQDISTSCPVAVSSRPKRLLPSRSTIASDEQRRWR